MTLIDVIHKHPELELAFLLECQQTIDGTAKETDKQIHDAIHYDELDDSMMLLLMEEIYYLEEARHDLNKRLLTYLN